MKKLIFVLGISLFTVPFLKAVENTTGTDNQMMFLKNKVIQDKPCFKAKLNYVVYPKKAESRPSEGSITYKFRDKFYSFPYLKEITMYA